MINQPSRPAYAAPTRSYRVPPWSGTVKYLPDALAAMIVVCMSMRLPGLGPVLAVTWMGCAALLVLIRPAAAGATLIRWWPLLIFPLLAFLSFLWSDTPEISARYGFQLLLTTFLGVLISRALPPARFAIAMFIGLFIFCIASIASRNMGPSEDGLVLIGLTGSKNAMAFAGNILLASSLAVLFLPGVKSGLRVLGAVGLVMAIYISMVTASATAVVLTFITIILFVAMCILERLPAAARTALLLSIAVTGAVSLLLQNEITELWHTFLRDVLHKSPTLTGRTFLWAFADELISRKPLFGYGYQSFWMGESADTIGVLRWAGQGSGRGFNFHHTYRQIMVDTGIVGVSALILTIVIVIIAGTRTFLIRPSATSSFVFAFFLLSLSKSFTEVILGPFNAQTMLFFACAAYVLADTSARRVAPAGPVLRPNARAPGNLNAFQSRHRLQ